MQNEHPTRVSRIARRDAFVFSAMALAGTVCTALALLLMSSGAHAQAVRKCTIEGRVVFQAQACPIERAAAPTVAAKPDPAAADPAAPPKKKTLADLLRERDGADARRAPVREMQGDGANVLRSRMGAV